MFYFLVKQKIIPLAVSILFLSLLGCSSNDNKNRNPNILKESSAHMQGDLNDKYRIHFYKIDNLAKVYVNGQLVFVSSFINNNPELDLAVGLSKSMTPGKNTIRVELYNGLQEEIETLKEVEAESMDESWEVYYEVFREDEPIDFVHEKANNKKAGLVFASDHEIQMD